MALTDSWTPPAQPGIGTLTYVPLGGDGFTAPQAAYAINSYEIVGDASGGKVSMTIEMDKRFVSLVSFVSLSVLQATSADIDYRLVVGSSSGTDQVASHQESGPIVAISSTVSNAEINKTMPIMPMMLPGAGQSGKILMELKNVDTDRFRVSALIYLFNIRVRELTAMGPLLWSRGAT